MGKIVFPRDVYKKGGPLKWNRGITYSKEYVTNETEYKAALKAGYIDDFSEALLGDNSPIEGDFEEVEDKKPVEKTEKKSFFNKSKPVDVDTSVDDDF